MKELKYKWVSFKGGKRMHLIMYPKTNVLCGFDIVYAVEQNKQKPYCYNCEVVLARLKKNPDLKITIV